jgi:hypothetical protein
MFFIDSQFNDCVVRVLANSLIVERFITKTETCDFKR